MRKTILVAALALAAFCCGCLSVTGLGKLDGGTCCTSGAGDCGDGSLLYKRYGLFTKGDRI